MKQSTLFSLRHPGPSPLIRVGDVVRIKPEWQDAGDASFTWIAIEDECDGRVRIEPQMNLPFRPNQIVSVSMLEPK